MWRSIVGIQSGGIFVDDSAEKYIRAILMHASLDRQEADEYAKQGIKDFESSAKRLFPDVSEDQIIAVAGSSINHPSVKIRRGRMTLPG